MTNTPKRTDVGLDDKAVAAPNEGGLSNDFKTVFRDDWVAVATVISRRRVSCSS